MSKLYETKEFKESLNRYLRKISGLVKVVACEKHGFHARKSAKAQKVRVLITTVRESRMSFLEANAIIIRRETGH